MAVGISVLLCPDCGEPLVNVNGWKYECEECGAIWDREDVNQMECPIKHKCEKCEATEFYKCKIFAKHAMGMQKTHTRRLAEHPLMIKRNGLR